MEQHMAYRTFSVSASFLSSYDLVVTCAGKEKPLCVNDVFNDINPLG